MSTFFKRNEQAFFFFPLSLSPTGPLTQVPRCSIDGELCRNQGGKMGRGGNAHRERGGDSGMEHHSWFLCLAFQMKTGPGLTGTRLSKKLGSEILDIRIWQVLYQHIQSALINPRTWERHKTWPGLYSKGGSAGLQDQAPQDCANSVATSLGLSLLPPLAAVKIRTRHFLKVRDSAPRMLSISPGA